MAILVFPDGMSGRPAAPGWGRAAGRRSARTLSVAVRDFTRPDAQAHEHMADRQDHNGNDWPNNRRSRTCR
jgi:hypothetical protein